MEIVEMNGMEIQIQIKSNLSTHVQLKPVYSFIYPKKSNPESRKILNDREWSITS